MATPAPAPSAVKKTAIATLNSNLAYSIERLDNSEVAIGLKSDGTFDPFTGTNYVNSATSIKDSVVILDGQVKNVSDTYATITYANQKITDLIGGAPSTLDTLKEIADALGDDANALTALSTQIDTESERAITAEETLTTNLATEITRATTAENNLSSALSAEVSRATTAEGVLTTGLANEVIRAEAAEADLQDAISAEILARQGAVTALETGTTELITSEYTTLNTAISDETSRATGVEGVLTTRLSAEVSRATNSENAIISSLNAEVERATAAEGVLTTDLADEVTRATDAENALDARLDTVEASYIQKDGSVAMTGDLNMDSHKVINVATPTGNQDAANKAYVDSKITGLGSVFEYIGTVDGGTALNPTDLGSLTNTHAGSYYRVTAKGVVSYGVAPDVTTIQVNIGDGLVSNKTGGWDLIDNTDVQVNGTAGKITVTGSVADGFNVSIDTTYVGQASINTVGTVTTGVWEANVVDTAYGGTNFSTYTQGDLLVGNSSHKLSKLAVGDANTILRSDGTDASWVVADTEHVALTSATNFGTSTNLQQALDYLYNYTQIRKKAQHVIADSSVLTATAAESLSGTFQAGKVVFVTYNASYPKIYLPKSTANVINGSVFRIVHNGVYTDGDLTVAYVDSNNIEHEILQLAPKDSISCVWNSSQQQYLFAVGI